MYNSSQANATPVITGGWLAKQTPEHQLAMLVAIAADRVAIDHLTNKQLAALAGLSVSQFREARRQHGAPIRPKRARQAPTPTLTSTSVDMDQLSLNAWRQQVKAKLARIRASVKTNGA